MLNDRFYDMPIFLEGEKSDKAKLEVFAGRVIRYIKRIQISKGHGKLPTC